MRSISPVVGRNKLGAMEGGEMLNAAALERAVRNQSQAARMLGTIPQALSQRLKRDNAG